MKIFNALQLQYERLDEQFRQYIAKKLGQEASQYTSSNIFGMILNVIRSLSQNFMLYLEDSVQEQNILTATRRNSIFSLAKLSGYEPFYGYAASGTLKLNLQPHNLPQKSKILIPNHTRVQHVQTGMIYNIILPLDYYTIDLDRTFTTVNLPIVAGTFRTATWNAKGLPLEAFDVTTNTFYDINYIKVTVNGDKWERYACLYDMQGDVKGYVIQQSFDGEFQIVFGNGTHGKLLEDSDTVTCEYLTHSGSQQNLNLSNESSFRFYDPIKSFDNEYIDGNKFIVLYTINYVTGGADADSVENVRQMTGFNSRALVLASEDNYKLFLSRFSFIGYNRVWTYDNSMAVNILGLQKHYLTDPIEYFSLKKSDFQLTDEHKNIINNTLDNSKQMIAGTNVYFVDPIIRDYALICYVKIDPKYGEDDISYNIRHYTAQYFINLKGDCRSIAKSDISKYLLDNIQGILSIDLQFVSGDDEQGFVTGYYDTYVQKFVNGAYKLQKQTLAYDSQNPVGLDNFSNIVLKSNMEYPVLIKGIRYYTDRSDKRTNVILDAVNIYYI